LNYSIAGIDGPVQYGYSKKGNMKTKIFTLLAIMFLGSYPVIELTRVIVVSGTAYYPNMRNWFAVEIAAMWFLYLSIIPVYLFFTRTGFSLNRKKVTNDHAKG
jgi:hypothetical protein